MKQHITIEQWYELSEKLRDKYHEYIIKKYPLERRGYFVLNRGIGYLLTIGQMIEFLDEQPKETPLNLKPNKLRIEWDADKELCDVLWDKVKEVLEQ